MNLKELIKKILWSVAIVFVMVIGAVLSFIFVIFLVCWHAVFTLADKIDEWRERKSEQELQ